MCQSFQPPSRTLSEIKLTGTPNNTEKNDNQKQKSKQLTVMTQILWKNY